MPASCYGCVVKSFYRCSKLNGVGDGFFCAAFFRGVPDDGAQGTVAGAGPDVQDAAQGALDAGTVDAFLGYLNDGVYVARALSSPRSPGTRRAPERRCRPIDGWLS